MGQGCPTTSCGSLVLVNQDLALHIQTQSLDPVQHMFKAAEDAGDHDFVQRPKRSSISISTSMA